MPLDELILLGEIQALLSQPDFVPPPRQHQHWERLKVRIQGALARLDAVPHPAISVVQKKLAGSVTLRVLSDEHYFVTDDDGIWVRGFIHVDQADLASFIDRRAWRMRKALAALPEISRAVFTSHCQGGLPYHAIAAELGISIADVERELAIALAALDRAL